MNFIDFEHVKFGTKKMFEVLIAIKHFRRLFTGRVYEITAQRLKNKTANPHNAVCPSDLCSKMSKITNNLSGIYVLQNTIIVIFSYYNRYLVFIIIIIIIIQRDDVTV